SFGEIVDEAGGVEAFLDGHAVILVADHAQTDVRAAVPLASALGTDWAVLAAGIYLLSEGRRRVTTHAGVRARLRVLDGVDLIGWLNSDNGSGPEAVVETARGELRCRPGSQLSDRRGARWDVEGELAALSLRPVDGALDD